MRNAIELIQKRISTRTYSAQPVEKEKLDAISKFISELESNPFGAKVRISLFGSEASGRLGTYGLIKGANTYLAACVKKDEKDLEGLGYEFEEAVLYATSLGLGTCWIGGIFTRGAFAELMKPQDELLPVISPLGYAAEKKSVVERIVAAGAGARKRKPGSELFFDGDWTKPLEAQGDMLTCLEMVRLAPSASNKQPWRALRTESGLHFYMKKDNAYIGNKLGFCLQRIDMGIAACHLSLAAQQLGLNGAIVIDDPKLTGEAESSAGLYYSFSWR